MSIPVSWYYRPWRGSKPCQCSAWAFLPAGCAPLSAWSSSNRVPSSRRSARSDCIVRTSLLHCSDSESPVTSSPWKERGEIVIVQFLTRQWTEFRAARVQHRMRNHFSYTSAPAYPLEGHYSRYTGCLPPPSDQTPRVPASVSSERYRHELTPFSLISELRLHVKRPEVLNSGICSKLYPEFPDPTFICTLLNLFNGYCVS